MKLFHHPVYALKRSQNKSVSYKSLTWILVLMGLLTFPQTKLNAATLFDYDAVYSGRYFGFNVKFERKLKKKSDHEWQLSHNFSNFWIKIHEESNFKLNDNNITAQRYIYTRKGIGKNRSLDIQFDHAKAEALVKRGDKERRYKIDSAVIDKLNYQVALRLAMVADPQLRSFSTNIVDRSHVKNYTITFDANETLKTELGKVDTVRFRRDRKNDKGEIISSTIIWMVPEWQYLPARIQQIDDGKKYTLDIESLKVRNPPANSALKAFKS